MIKFFRSAFHQNAQGVLDDRCCREQHKDGKQESADRVGNLVFRTTPVDDGGSQNYTSAGYSVTEHVNDGGSHIQVFLVLLGLISSGSILEVVATSLSV